MDKISIPLSHNYINNLSEHDYYSYFLSNDKKAGSISEIILYQKPHLSNKFNRNSNLTGGGFFQFIKSIAKKSLPFIQKYILPEVGSFTSQLIKDLKKK